MWLLSEIKNQIAPGKLPIRALERSEKTSLKPALFDTQTCTF
jgi:hypothetical protein